MDTTPMGTAINVAVAWLGRTSADGCCRALNRLNISYIVVLPHEVPFTPFTHILLTGSPRRVQSTDTLPEWITQATCPVLAIGYGMQLWLRTHGAVIEPIAKAESGPTHVTEILEGQQQRTIRWMAREDRIVSVPDAFTVTGVTDSNDIAAVTDGQRFWGVQYHPEARRFGDDSVIATFTHR